MGTPQGQVGADEKDKYLIDIKQIASDRITPTDVEEGMRVGVVDRNQVSNPNSSALRRSTPSGLRKSRKSRVWTSHIPTLLGCSNVQIEKHSGDCGTAVALSQSARFISPGIDPPKGVLASISGARFDHGGAGGDDEVQRIMLQLIN